MLATRCSACGAPTPIALRDDFTRCEHCHAHVPLPEAALTSLVAARGLLATLDVRHRQLSAVERRALAWEGRLHGCFLVVFGALALLMLGFIALFTLALFVGEGGFSLYTFSWFFVPLLATLVLFAGMGALHRRRLMRARHALEVACAAIPPRHPGEPASCHVCGASLPSYGSAAVARCDYCSADNLVAPHVLARATRDEALVLESFEASVRREASVGQRSAAKGIFLLPVFALGSILTTCCIWGTAIYLAVQIEGEITGAEGLVWIDVPDYGRCVLSESATHAGSARWSLEREARYPIGARRDVVRPRELEGTTLLHHAPLAIGPERLRIERAYSTPLFPGTVYLRARNDAGDVIRIEILSGLCKMAE